MTTRKRKRTKPRDKRRSKNNTTTRTKTQSGFRAGKKHDQQVKFRRGVAAGTAPDASISRQVALDEGGPRVALVTANRNRVIVARTRDSTS